MNTHFKTSFRSVWGTSALFLFTVANTTAQVCPEAANLTAELTGARAHVRFLADDRLRGHVLVWKAAEVMGHAEYRVLFPLALLGPAAAPPTGGVAEPGSAQAAPALARALGELGVGAADFAALPAAARGLFGLVVGIKAAAGPCIDALRLERASSSWTLD